MDWKKPALRIVSITIIALCAIFLSVMYSLWVNDLSANETRDYGRNMENLVRQTLGKVESDLRDIPVLFSQANTIERIEEAYSYWSGLEPDSNLIQLITLMKLSRQFEIASFEPRSGKVSTGLADPFLLQLFGQVPEMNQLDWIRRTAMLLIGNGYYLQFMGQAPGADFRTGSLLIIKLNRELIFSHLIPDTIASEMPGYGYRIFTLLEDRNYAASSGLPKRSPDLSMLVSGNLVQNRIVVEQENSLLPEYGSVFFTGPRIRDELPAFRDVSIDDSMLVQVDFYIPGGPVERIILLRKVLLLTAGNGAILVLLGGTLLFALLYARSRSLRLREKEFVASVSHELRTPLAVIMAASDNLSQGIITERDRITTYGCEIRKQGGRLSRMVEGILMYARVDRRQLLNPRHETVNSRHLIYDIVKPLGDILTSAQVEFTIASETLPDEIEVDPASLAIIIENLIMNAHYHGKPPDQEEKQKISLSIAVENDTLVLTVEDNGPGISRFEKKKVFRAFYRGEKSVKDQHPGSGIGLYLVRGVCRALNGTINLISKPGPAHGSIAQVQLPLRRMNAG